MDRSDTTGTRIEFLNVTVELLFLIAALLLGTDRRPVSHALTDGAGPRVSTGALLLVVRHLVLLDSEAALLAAFAA